MALTLTLSLTLTYSVGLRDFRTIEPSDYRAVTEGKILHLL